MTKSAFVAIVGKPNVGKSSLLNLLVGEKIAIISDKPQTTRTRITGVLTEGETQLVFIDTPGLHKPKNKLGDYMVKQVTDSVGDVDCAVFVTDPLGEVTEAEMQLIENIRQLHLPAILVINKIDTLQNKEDMVKKMVTISGMYDFEEVVPISVYQKDGTELLLKLIQDQAQEGPHFFPNDTLTDQPEKVIVAEIIREKVLRNMRDEIPHGTAVVIERMREHPGKDIMDIDATILCEKSSHKGMIIGKQGSMLKKIASQSRQEIESFLETRVNLQCWVKIREDWRNSEFSIRDLGFN
ncbi:GTPase Era [Negativibacillus massiliensis]|uniref:GTPase Era n=1 Tax=Negativibacillus massiliensis TaxID=1871035 RepID=UPI0023F89053|nr:GTPase Era [Negativibacillus massiliensis]